MIRAILVAIISFVTQLFFSSLFSQFGLSIHVSLVPAVLILVTNEFKPHEALFSLLFLGLLIDGWIGAPIGTIMLTLSVLFALAAVGIKWIGRLDYWIRTAFIFLFSLAFRVSVALALGIVGGTLGNWDGLAIFFMPLIDAIIGTGFYSINLRFLPLLGLSEVREDTSQRLSRRSPRISLE